MNTSLTIIAVGLVVAIIFIIIRKMQSNAEAKELEIKLDLDNKIMANAEPEEFRCRICAKNFLDGGPFKRYKRALFCLDCYNQFVKLKKENEFNRTAKLLNVEVKAGDK